MYVFLLNIPCALCRMYIAVLTHSNMNRKYMTYDESNFESKGLISVYSSTPQSPIKTIILAGQEAGDNVIQNSWKSPA